MKRQRESEEERTGKVAKTANGPPKPVDRLRSVGPLPEGWLDCPHTGEPIANIIPSKVPLGETFNELLDPGKRFSRRHVVRHQQALGRKVGWSYFESLNFSDILYLLRSTNFFP